MNKRLILIAVLASIYSGLLFAMDLSLAIQPIVSKSQIIKVYQPLADYISQKTGHNVRINAHLNFLTYWSAMRRANKMDLILDAAHFTDYRVMKKEYEILAKIPDTVSFSIVTHEDELIFDAEELILKKVATMVSPGVGGLRMSRIFNNPMRQPRIVYAKNSNDAVQRVVDKTVFAAIIPTSLVSSFGGLNTVLTTETLPHMAFSASPRVPKEVKEAIKQVLIEAKNNPQGREMLEKVKISAFEATSAEVYKGHSALLKNVLGY